MEKVLHLVILSCFLLPFCPGVSCWVGDVAFRLTYWLLTRDLHHWALVRGVKLASFCASRYLVAALDVARCYWLDNSRRLSPTHPGG
jgi:multisubunit Na+/H+ antiporter MnhE subunit